MPTGYRWSTSVRRKFFGLVCQGTTIRRAARESGVSYNACSITWDRGSEMGNWRQIHMQLDTPVYFCNPHSPWQRGSNENTNRLLRFWFEKGTDLSGYTKADLKRIQDTLNRRPRPTLDLDTPANRLAAPLSQAA